jgi:hypothetical protein
LSLGIVDRAKVEYKVGACYGIRNAPLHKKDMKENGAIRLKTRLIKSKYADVPSSIEFSIVRSVREEKSGKPRPKNIAYIGRLNGWLTDPKFKPKDILESKETNKFHRGMRAYVLLLRRPKSLADFYQRAERKIDELLAAGKITKDEKKKLITQLIQKMPK